jgi:hypothetical protein
MTTLKNFQAAIATIFGCLSSVAERLGSVDSGCRRSADILQSIQDYRLDIDRDTAKAAITEINARVIAIQTEASKLEPINFDELWPEDGPKMISEVLQAEEAFEKIDEPEIDGMPQK